MKYYDPEDQTSYIPVGTGQIISIPLKDLEAFNEAMNKALLTAMANIRRDTEPQPSVLEPCSCGGRHFVCALCGGEFHSDPAFTEEMRLEEERSLFGEVQPEDRRSVCGTCFLKIHPQRN